MHAGFDTVSAAQGARVPLVVNAGTPAAMRPYLVLGSGSGTQPGIPFAGVTLPLNRDKFFRFTSRARAAAAARNTTGGSTRAAAPQPSSSALPQTLLPWVGSRIDWSVVVFTAKGASASAPVGFDVLP